jgi:hypothetical protein
MEITNLRSGSKFILTENITLGSRIFPKGLVVCLINLKILRSGKTARFLVSRSKNVISKCYAGISEESYKPSSRWDSWKKFTLQGPTFEFIDLYFKPFDEEYDSLVNTKPII